MDHQTKMKTAFRVSILLNLGLLGWLLISPIHRVKPVAEPVVATQPPAPVIAPVMLSPSNPAPASPESFHWNHLYACDYHAYVKNLRAIGCPESTVRAIVAADVHAVFQPEVDDLKKKLSDLASRSWASQIGSLTNAEAWQAELQQLPDEESAMIADYLGETVASPSPLPVTRKRRQPVDDPDAPVEVPLVAQDVNLTALNLDKGQLQAIDDLRTIFMQKIGGPNQDPNDPAYLSRWRTAQAEVDNLMQGMLGNQAYLDYQQLAFAAAQAHSAQNTQSADASTTPGTTGN
jgi:hypothetical protein